MIKRMFLIKVFVLFLASFFITGCPETESKAEELMLILGVLGSAQSPVPSVSPDPSVVTWTDLQTKIAVSGAPSCSTCHNGTGPASVNLTNFTAAGVNAYLGVCPSTSPTANKLINNLSPGGKMYNVNSSAALSRNAIAGWIQNGCQN
ncbi:MAG: hypothetical protein OEZ34_01900 [Spirochaetia bacterium]|nr:hypothetical protein [Spirochaetia bacterium]